MEHPVVTLFEEEQAPAPAQPLCASLRSRNAWWTSGKSQEQFYVRIFRKMSRLRPRQPFCASLRNRNAHGHVARAILYENSQVQCRRQRSKKSRAADFLRESVQSKCTWRCHKSQFLYENLQGKVTPGDRENRFREPAQSKCTWTCQNFMREFSGKLPQTKIKDGSRGRLWASLHSRNAHKSSQEYFMREFSGKMPRTETGTNKQFARACAVQIPLHGHADMSEESHYARIFR